jgi:hypothetical protein
LPSPSPADAESEPLPVKTVEPEEHGYLPAAAIFAAQGVASVLATARASPGSSSTRW